MARAIMLQGTGSDVGKTVLVAALCRLARNRGLTVRPFKPQNMSNNAAVCADGGEIGRAQWLQALACGVPPSVHMNPVLLKPQSEQGSQVVIHGEVWGTARGRDYQAIKPRFMDAVMQSFERLGAEADLVIVEGAGSPAEINLRAGDIANMGFATRADVPVVLVGDIDRGGVIASLVGTHTILPEGDRAMVSGFIINKFRGDISLFDDGITAVTGHTGWPCFGVVPWLSDAARLPAEDSVVLERLSASGGSGMKIAVFVLDRIANFDDADPLASEPGVDLVMVRPGDRLPRDAALAVIPGSKSTIADLDAFRAQGWADDLAGHVARGGHVLGLCGGYQMLGRMVHDPGGLEGPARSVEGLALLDVETRMEPQKTVRSVSGRAVEFDCPVEGYEIHLGQTTGPDTTRPVAVIDGVNDGARSADGRIAGTYLHGLFSGGALRQRWLQKLGATSAGEDHLAVIDAALDRLAEAAGEALDTQAMAGF